MVEEECYGRAEMGRADQYILENSCKLMQQGRCPETASLKFAPEPTLFPLLSPNSCGLGTSPPDAVVVRLVVQRPHAPLAVPAPVGKLDRHLDDRALGADAQRGLFVLAILGLIALGCRRGRVGPLLDLTAVLPCKTAAGLQNISSARPALVAAQRLFDNGTLGSASIAHQEACPVSDPATRTIEHGMRGHDFLAPSQWTFSAIVQVQAFGELRRQGNHKLLELAKAGGDVVQETA